MEKDLKFLLIGLGYGAILAIISYIGNVYTSISLKSFATLALLLMILSHLWIIKHFSKKEEELKMARTHITLNALAWYFAVLIFLVNFN